ncbi:FadR/GntR family transcriptional regulator [Microbacterium telephonicum]|uniref:DNA-binding FadR family transcriptional regulator n=1 Tax=Microbacterium telephonicum TaxID=1714841 RepID=A0A498C0D9_9MICO|nr:FCD domain-containing protein [Microbacterium telephonicum]RLK46600.1 DNA-binding FadR family transcriptional regulator [Microbacterium telephonicum]
MTDASAAAERSIARAPIDRIGAAVLAELVESIVSGRVTPGEVLPPEAVLSTQFGVSRTVIRESMKRLQEKGMVTVAQGRGTHVNPMTSWNLLDPMVLRSLIGHDDTLGILDDLSVVRSAVEAEMAAAAASAATDESGARLRSSLDRQREVIDDGDAFREADVAFHHVVMEMSGNLLAQNIALVLLERAVESARYQGIDPEHAFETTLAEHDEILAAIVDGDAARARAAMAAHILGSWTRRRLPTVKD